jgi:sterol desaturase/sphingolipid hydroxylase (fatty acid hydroxylase superfamily)
VIDLPDPVRLAMPVFLGLMLVEALYGRFGGRVRYAPGDTGASLIMGAGNMVVGALTGTSIAVLAFWLYDQARLVTLPASWWVLAACFVLDDLLFYVFHRSAHRVRWFWASHVVHHSSQHYNLSTALRQTWTGPLSLSFAFRLPLVLLGFPPAMVFFCAGLNFVYQLWIHTEAIRRLPGWIEAVMNTPSHHRVHHATNPGYVDRNYGGVFIIWDRLFGSFVAERPDEPCRYGILPQLSSNNPLRIALHEWIRIVLDVWHAANWRHRLRFLIGPPGWTPEAAKDIARPR